MKDKVPESEIIDGKLITLMIAKDITEEAKDHPEVLERLTPNQLKRVYELVEEDEE